MTSNTDAGIKRLFRQIFDRNMSSAKTILKEQFFPEDQENQGRYTAARGIISMLDNKSVDKSILEDSEKMMRLRKLLIRQVGSIWCNDFDKGYFDTWIRYINYARRHSSSDPAGKKGVDKDPSEKEQHDITS